MAVSDDPDFVDGLLREFDGVRKYRGMWDIQYEDVARLVLPQFQNSFIGDAKVPGIERGADMFDVTANTALFRFAAAMESMLTPRNGRWHRFQTVDPALMKKRSVALWCDQVNDLLFHYRYAPSANYQSQQHDGYVSLGAFGTSGLFVDQLRSPGRRGLRYKNLHLGEMFLAQNHQGIVDTVYRRYRMTLRQIVQRWGVDALEPKLASVFEKQPEEEAFVIHAIRPREDRDPRRIDAKGMRYGSYYLLEEGRKILEEGGFRTFPIPTSRYLTAPNEVYGRSPAMMVLPAIKVLNEEKRTMLKAGHRAVDPVLLAHDDGVLNGFSLKPGAINSGAVSAEGKPLVHALPIGSVQTGKELMDDERAGINDAFLVSLFQILTERPQMTATEVLERAREKGALLSPTMGRFQSESLGPMITREYDLLRQQGLLPPPPPEIAGQGIEWKVEFDAPLNRAMRAEEGAGMQRTVQFAIEASQAIQDPSLLDVFDFDATLTDLADINAVPFRWMADPAVVAQKRKTRQQQATIQQMVQAAPGIAQTLKAAAPQGAPATQP